MRWMVTMKYKRWKISDDGEFWFLLDYNVTAEMRKDGFWDEHCKYGECFERKRKKKKALNLFLCLWCQNAERGKIKSEGGNKEILNWMYVRKKD